MRAPFVFALVLPALFLGEAASAASSNIVISEFRTRGPNGANDEFIELYNKSNATVVVTGWRILVSDAAGNTTVLKQLGAVSIRAHRFFLLSNTGAQGYSGTVSPNSTYTVGIADDGGLSLEQPGGAVVDRVGTSAGSAYLEGTPLAPLSANTNQSYERNEGGCSPGRDTDDNSTDFRFNATRSFPQNATTICNPCQGVQCVAPPNSQCFEAPGTCNQGVCIYPQLAVGAACSDIDPCTTGDACAADGSCLSGAPNPCATPPDAFCSDPQTSVTFAAVGVCSSSAGCEYTDTPTACAFGCNGTTGLCQPDPCTNLTCNSPPAGGCYDPAGACVAGTCVYTTRAAGTACSDANACTTGDQCNANGRCLAGPRVPVDDGNPCTTDACARATGQVSHTAVTNGTNCDDGNGCNGVSTCQTGTCTAGTPVTCDAPPIGGCYEASGTCNPANGACSFPFSAEDKSCDDGDPCTTTDHCDGNGSCEGATVVCPAPASTCSDATTSRSFSQGTCSPSSGACVFVSTDTACSAGCDPASGLCNADPCIGVSCVTPPSQCNVDPGACAGGVCNYPLKPAGANCDDADPCTSADTCGAAGECSGTPLLCNLPPLPACLDSVMSRQFEATGTCSAGACNYDSVDVPCSTGCDVATGLCAGDPCAGIACDEPPSQCHLATGDCAGGICTYALKPASSNCDDGAACTVSDECSGAGVCAGSPVVCNTPPVSVCVNGTTQRSFEAVGTCAANTGTCAYASADTACATTCNAATGLCAGDPCASTACDTPPGACFLTVGTCSGGDCSYTPRPSGIDCDDGDPCTVTDQCNGSGVCAGTPGSGCSDGGVDAGPEAGVDASTGAGGQGVGGQGVGGQGVGGQGVGGQGGTDGGADAGPDSGREAGVDAGVDAGPDSAAGGSGPGGNGSGASSGAGGIASSTGGTSSSTGGTSSSTGGTSSSSGGRASSSGGASSSSGGRASSSGGDSSSSGGESEDNVGNRVEGGACTCTMAQTGGDARGLFALVAGALLLTRRRSGQRKPGASAAGGAR